jgi:hypothetical protein
MQLEIAIIDAFTNQTFRGNPAATILVDEFPEEAKMKQIAAEMNLSETAFAKHLDKNSFKIISNCDGLRRNRKSLSVAMLPSRSHIICANYRCLTPIYQLFFLP